jgi:hypothetical protein
MIPALPTGPFRRTKISSDSPQCWQRERIVTGSLTIAGTPKRVDRTHRVPLAAVRKDKLKGGGSGRKGVGQNHLPVLGRDQVLLIQPGVTGSLSLEIGTAVRLDDVEELALPRYGKSGSSAGFAGEITRRSSERGSPPCESSAPGSSP